jgi:hypothetical protein
VGLGAYGVIIGVRWFSFVRNCNATVTVAPVSRPENLGRACDLLGIVRYNT